MKKISILSVIFLLFVGFSFVSCDVEPIDSAVLNQNDTTNNGGGNNNTGGGGNNTGGGGNNTGGGSSSGDYWPTAINNQWTYNQNGSVIAPNKIIGTDVFNGATYYKFTQASGGSGSTTAAGTSWLNKNAGVYKIKIDDLIIDAGGITGTQSGYEFIALKDNLAVGQSWNGTYSQTTDYPGVATFVQTSNYTGTILAIGATETVNGEVFNNVIKMKLHVETNLSGSISVQDVEYWYAKDVGPIRTLGTGFDSILVDYILN